MTTFQILEQFCEIVQGGRHKLSGNDFVKSGYPAYGAGGMNGYLATFEFDESAVILSSIGARCGKCFYVEGRWSSLANTQVIFPDKNECDAKFLWYQLNDEKRWPRAGTGQPFIKPSDVKRHKVFLPPIEEQRRIAAILDQAETLRTQRRTALALLDSLTQSLFLDMFGAGESYGWPVTSIGEIVDEENGGIRTGPFGSQLLHSEFVDEGVAVLGIDNAVNNEFRWDERRYITHAKYEDLKRYTVRPGDVLITIMGTCGRCAVVPDDIPLAINTKHLCCISVDRRRVVPDYLHAYFLRHPTARKYLEQTAKGAIMSGLNMGIIKAMPIALPPLPLQQTFTTRIASIEALKATHRRALAALQQRAFAGQL